jgi:hypothetical protein
VATLAQQQGAVTEGGFRVAKTTPYIRFVITNRQEGHPRLRREQCINNMGFKQRERGRREKAAQIAAQRVSRTTGSAEGKWWLTLVGIDTCCARCGQLLRRGMEMIYRARPREALCLRCAERDAMVRKAWRPSVRWERERRRGRK